MKNNMSASDHRIMAELLGYVEEGAFSAMSAKVLYDMCKQSPSTPVLDIITSSGLTYPEWTNDYWKDLTDVFNAYSPFPFEIDSETKELKPDYQKALRRMMSFYKGHQHPKVIQSWLEKYWAFITTQHVYVTAHTYCSLPRRMYEDNSKLVRRLDCLEDIRNYYSYIGVEGISLQRGLESISRDVKDFQHRVCGIPNYFGNPKCSTPVGSMALDDACIILTAIHDPHRTAQECCAIWDLFK